MLFLNKGRKYGIEEKQNKLIKQIEKHLPGILNGPGGGHTGPSWNSWKVVGVRARTQQQIPACRVLLTMSPEKFLSALKNINMIMEDNASIQRQIVLEHSPNLRTNVE